MKTTIRPTFLQSEKNHFWHSLFIDNFNPFISQEALKKRYTLQTRDFKMTEKITRSENLRLQPAPTPSTTAATAATAATTSVFL